MRLLVLLLLAAGNASAMECWRAALGDQGNVSLLCLDGARDAEHRFHFSNKGTQRPPTDCTQKGSFSRQAERIEVTLADGTCTNGRETAASRIDCEPPRGRSMACRVNDEKWKFERVFP